MTQNQATSEPRVAVGLKVGQQVADRYEITNKLGAGGFAVVFQARDDKLDRDVAVKLLNLAALVRDGQTSEQHLNRFRREAKLAARVDHPNVVDIYDYGVLEDNQYPYIVMEMLDGYDLADELNDRGAMAPQRALPLFRDALDALGAGHRVGIVHKDLKPANLFLTQPGTRYERLKIVDFGIAHIGESDEGRLTQTGTIFGTPQYLAPEYIEHQQVTPAMDIYQMGLLLVETLSGEPVVKEQNFWQCAKIHVSRNFELPARYCDGALKDILARALAYEPGARFADAAAFADALDEVDIDDVIVDSAPVAGDESTDDRPAVAAVPMGGGAAQSDPAESQPAPSQPAPSVPGIVDPTPSRQHKPSSAQLSDETGAPGESAAAQPTPAVEPGPAGFAGESPIDDDFLDNISPKKKPLRILIGLIVAAFIGALLLVSGVFSDKPTASTSSNDLEGPSTTQGSQQDLPAADLSATAVTPLDGPADDALVGAADAGAHPAAGANDAAGVGVDTGLDDSNEPASAQPEPADPEPADPDPVNKRADEPAPTPAAKPDPKPARRPQKTRPGRSKSAAEPPKNSADKPDDTTKMRLAP